MRKSLLLPLLAVLLPALAGTAAQARSYIEVRTYHFASEERAGVFDKMMKDAGIGALARAGVKPVGVFKPKDPAAGGGEVIRVMVLPFASLEAWATLAERVGEDGTFFELAGDYLNAEKSNPVFKRCGSVLLAGFDGKPDLAVPGAPKGDGRRLFELRIYESHSELKGKLKVQMFNQGELEIFDKVGLRSVFFGEALAAPNLPQLTYLLVYEDDAERKAAWARFLAHPDWDRMKQMEVYKDTVSKIHSHFLLPTGYSQIQ